MPFVFPDVSSTHAGGRIAIPPDIVRFGVMRSKHGSTQSRIRVVRFTVGLDVVKAAWNSEQRLALIIGIDRGFACLRRSQSGRALCAKSEASASYRTIEFPADKVTLFDASGQILEPSIYVKCPSWRVDGMNLILTLPTAEDVKKQEDAYCMDREA